MHGETGEQVDQLGAREVFVIDGHTLWLVHFVPGRRDEDEEDYSEDDGDSDSDETTTQYAGPFAVLRNILAAGGLLADYMPQDGSTAIFGGQPVVCATELPLYSFAKYAEAHDDASSPSPLGVAFLKSEFYGAGGRPVIYGLSGPVPPCTVNTESERLLPESALPAVEQYRYLPHTSGRDPWADQIRKREWRWRVTNEEQDVLTWNDEEGDYAEIPGLQLYGLAEHGCHFTKTRFIVWDEAQAREMQEIATCLYLV